MFINLKYHVQEIRCLSILQFRFKKRKNRHPTLPSIWKRMCMYVFICMSEITARKL